MTGNRPCSGWGHCVLFLTGVLLVLGTCLAPTASAEELTGKVLWIYDGDTIKVSGIGKVRLIGIDTPEHERSDRDRSFTRLGIPARNLRPTAKAALHYNIDRVKNHPVRLVTDTDTHDRYGRLLAYVYLDDGTLLNRLLLEQGFAIVYRRFDFALKEDFLAAEARAQNARKGLWATQ